MTTTTTRTYTLETHTGEQFTIQARSPYEATEGWVWTHDIPSARVTVTTPGEPATSYDVTDYLPALSTTRPRLDSGYSLPPLDLLLETQ